ncbi:hypothetical protein CLAFUW4_10793 [Fulvia fulva]|nr:hypothetical protein CLAFUR4_10798 [Fulvia fulva]WPV17149.1 hypothetical protein CLAFUW4_10793 [Fulvia fulva]WPV32238.1 hypothetical protein CLAFUW7_10791 [Fulvia fulva]
MPISRTSIIFVSGAWHTSFHIQPVIPHLEKAGYRIIPCPLPAAGTKGSTYEENYTAIQNAAEEELALGQNVALILHSAGGASGCEAVNQLLASPVNTFADSIQIIFLASFIAHEHITKRLMEEGHIRFDAGEGVIYHEKPYEGFFNDMDREKARPFVEALTFFQPTQVEFSSDVWQKVPLTHVVCERDESVLPETQVALAEQYGMKVVRLDARHDPFVSQPEKFVEVVDGILKG